MTRSKTVLIAMMLSTAAITSTAWGGPIRYREHRQQVRIAQGVRSGELTPRETARLEKQEAKLNYEVAEFREANGGKLTPGERIKVERQQNYLSREIFRAKHN